MSHVSCDIRGFAQNHILKSKMAAMYFALCQSLKFSQIAFENVQNRIKTVLWTLIALNITNMGKTLML